MSFNDVDILDFVSRREKEIKEKYKEIKKMEDSIKCIREKCSDNIVVCVSKSEYYMGKDKFVNNKNICLLCGKEIHLISNDAIVLDISNFETGFTDTKDDIEYKILTIRREYCDILDNNRNISKEELKIELNKRLDSIKTASDSKKKKVLEKTL